MFTIITKAKQKAFEAQHEGTNAADQIPCICGYCGRACRQMEKDEGANRNLCMGCPLAEFSEQVDKQEQTQAQTAKTEHHNTAELLKQFTAAAEKVEVYIPSTRNIIEHIDNAEHIEKGGRLFAELFGGFSTMEVGGGWVSDSAGLVLEKPTILYAYTNTETLEAALQKVIDFAQWLKREQGQDSILIVVSGNAYFI